MSGIRASLKKIIPAGLWPMFRFFDKYLIDLLYTYFWLRRAAYSAMPASISLLAPGKKKILHTRLRPSFS